MNIRKPMLALALGAATFAAAGLLVMGGTSAALRLTINPVQHALAVAGARLCRGGNCKILIPARSMPADRVGNQIEMFFGHRTIFYLTNSRNFRLAQQVFDGYTKYSRGEAIALMGTYVLAVKQPAQMCYWFTRARHVAHLPLAVATDGNWGC